MGTQQNPTIIAASLDDTALRKSVTDLVTMVEANTKKMASAFDEAVNSINGSLKRLSKNNGNDAGGSITKAAEAQTKQIKKLKFDLADAFNMPTNSLDQVSAKLYRIKLLYGQMKYAAAKQGKEVWEVFPTASILKAQKQIAVLQEAKSKQSAAAVADNKKETASYDEVAAAKKKAMEASQPKSARESYLAFMKGFKQQAEAVAQQIKEAEAALQNSLGKNIQQRAERLTAQIKKAEQGYVEAMNRMRAADAAYKGNQNVANLDALKKAQQEVKVYENNLARLRSTLRGLYDQSPKGVSGDADAVRRLEELRAKREQILGIMREETAAQQQAAQATQQQVQAQQQAVNTAKQYSEEVRKAAAEIRSSESWQKNGRYIQGDNVFYDPSRANMSARQREKLPALEEQIIEAQKRQAQAEAEITAARQKNISAAQQQAAAQQKITNAVEHTTDAELRAATMRHYRGTTRQGTDIRQYSELTTQIASILSVNEKEIKSVDKKTASYAQLSAYLKQLQSAYQRLGGDLVKTEGSSIIKEIQEVERAMQAISRTQKRPQSLKDVLGFEPKTLEEIAEKMRMLQQYRGGIDYTKPGAKEEIKAVNDELMKLQKRQNEYIGSTKRVSDANNALSRSWNYMKNRLAFYFTVGATQQFVKNLIDIRAQYEMVERALGILIDSAERGTQIFNELSAMALKSPFTLIELSTAAKQLTAYDIAAEDVVDTTRRLGDMAAAAGIGIDRLTYALGQVKAFGYLNARDARMFSNAGIPLVKELADHYTKLEGRLVSIGDVYTRMKKKTIDYATVMDVINRMTDEGGKYFNFQAKMAGTLKVELANLTLAWNNMLNDIGKDNQGIIAGGIRGLKQLFLAWKDINKQLRAFGHAITFGLPSIILWKMAVKGVAFETALASVTTKKFAASVVTAGRALKALAMNPMTWVFVAVAALASLADAIANANEASKELSKSMREGAKSTYDDLVRFFDNKEIRKIVDEINKGIKEIGADTANKNMQSTGYMGVQTTATEEDLGKAWENIREQIVLSSIEGEKFVKKLDTIGDKSARISLGYDYLEQMKELNAILKDIGDTGIVVTEDWSHWWNLWLGKDGLINNMKDYTEALDELNKIKAGSEVFDEADKIKDAEQDAKRALATLKGDIEETAQSLLNIALNNALSVEQQAELISKSVQKISAQGNLDPTQSYQMQLLATEQYAAMREQIYARNIASIQNQLANARDAAVKANLEASLRTNQEQFAQFKKTVNKQKVQYDYFTKWLEEHHGSAVRDMFLNMSEEEIKQINWSEPKWAEWARNYKEMFERETGIAFGNLQDWVKKANLWDIVIGITLTTNKDVKTLAEQVRETDSNLDTVLQDIKDTEVGLKRLRKKLKDTYGYDVDSKNKVPSALASQQFKDDIEAYNQGIRQLASLRENEKKLRASGAVSKSEERENKKNAAAAERERKKREREERQQRAAALREQKQGEDEVAKALQDEISLINEMSSSYDKLRKAGYDSQTAFRQATKGYDATIKSINAVLGKYGIEDFDAEGLVWNEEVGPQALIDALKKQLETLQKSGKVKRASLKTLEVEIQKLEVEAAEYNLQNITKGLDERLSKLTDSYELAVELDASPELGSIFTDVFKLNKSQLPHTFEDYLEQVNDEIDKSIDEINKLDEAQKKALGIKPADWEYGQKEIDDILTVDLNEYAKANGLDPKGELIQLLVKVQEDVKNRYKKFRTDLVKEWNTLNEKYADFNYKLIMATRETSKEYLSLIQNLGTKEQANTALDLVNKIKISTDPKKVAELSQELAVLAQLVAKEAGKDGAIELYTSITNAGGKRTHDIYAKRAKEIWDAFKDSDMYTMTFENMDNMGTEAIEHLLDELEKLKNVVKDDPASMKALVKQIETAEKELISRRPFSSVVQAIKDLKEAAGEAKQAWEDVDEAKLALAKTQGEYDTILAGGPEKGESLDGFWARGADAAEKVAKAQKELKDKTNTAVTATQNQAKAELKLTQGLQSAAQALNNVGSLMNTFVELLGIAEDSELGQFISGVVKGLSIMATVLGTVASVLALVKIAGDEAKAALGWIAAAAAALAVLVGLITWLSGSKNRKINREIEKSEFRVKALEYTYKDLENAIDDACGAAVSGAQQAAIANKQLQLAELERQLALEKSRSSKNYDQEKVLELQGQIRDLRREIDSSIKDITNSLLGISSVSSAAEDMANSLLEAFRNGEDYMANFKESFDEMIDSIIAKSIASHVIGKRLQDFWNYVDKLGEKNVPKNIKQELDEAVKMEADAAAEAAKDKKDQRGKYKVGDKWIYDADEYYEYAKKRRDEAMAAYAAARELSPEQIRQLKEGAVYDKFFGGLDEEFSAWMDSLGIGFGDKASKELSALQQGISGITEEQAGALEAYWNANTQQQYVHTDLLTQIRDTVVGFDADVQMATMAQILLQLQASYQVQMTIQSTLSGWSNPSGRAVRVEMI